MRKIFKRALAFALKVGMNYALILAGMVVATWVMHWRIYQIDMPAETLWFYLGVAAFGETFSTLLWWAISKCSELNKQTLTEKGESKD